MENLINLMLQRQPQPAAPGQGPELVNMMVPQPTPVQDQPLRLPPIGGPKEPPKEWQDPNFMYRPYPKPDLDPDFNPNDHPSHIFKRYRDRLPPCKHDGDSNCVWDAPTRGNGKGTSYVDIDGKIFREDGSFDTRGNYPDGTYDPNYVPEKPRGPSSGYNPEIWNPMAPGS